MMSTEHAHGEELRAVRARVVADEGALRELQRVARLAPPAELALSWEAGDAVGVVAALHAATNRDCAAARSAAAGLLVLAGRAGAVRQRLVACGAVEALVAAARTQARDRAVQLTVAAALALLCEAGAAARRRTGDRGGVVAVLAGMRAHSADAAVLEQGCWSLGALLEGCPENVERCTAAGGWGTVEDAMSAVPACAPLQVAPCPPPPSPAPLPIPVALLHSHLSLSLSPGDSVPRARARRRDGWRGGAGRRARPARRRRRGRPRAAGSAPPSRGPLPPLPPARRSQPLGPFALLSQGANGALRAPDAPRARGSGHSRAHSRARPLGLTARAGRRSCTPRIRPCRRVRAGRSRRSRRAGTAGARAWWRWGGITRRSPRCGRTGRARAWPRWRAACCGSWCRARRTWSTRGAWGTRARLKRFWTPAWSIGRWPGAANRRAARSGASYPPLPPQIHPNLALEQSDRGGAAKVFRPRGAFLRRGSGSAQPAAARPLAPTARSPAL